jgi:predicted small lipoprotein YifL
MSAIANSNQPEDKPKTSRVKSYWRNIPWKKLSSLVIAIALCFSLTACGDKKPASKAPDKKVVISTNIAEVSPPQEIQRLSRLLDRYTPQVSIVSPKPDEMLNDTQVSVKFDVKNLPIFKNADFGLGPHIHVTLDNQEYKAVYDLNQTATFDHLSAGTHTIRAFASRPWHESFKNQGAYAQTTFNILTKTGENTPDPKTPLLTYSRPVGTYGAEPVMLDFYLQNAPLHLLGKDDEAIDDWQVRATIDGQSFTFDRWEPIYLKGLKTGQNWVKLELLEPDGDAIANVFNSSAHVINYQPNGTDTLARLVRGEKIANIDAIVNPDYVPPAPEVIPAPVESVAPVVTPEVVTPVAAPKEETKPVDKASSVIPVVPVLVAPVIPVPVAPIAPIITKSSPVAEPVKVEPVPTKVVPVPEPMKVEPIKVKAAPVEPIKVAPVPTKVAPAPETVKVLPGKVKVAPVAVETIKTVPIKVKNTPVIPEAPKAEPITIVEPVKIAPTPIRNKYAPIAIPGRPIAPKVAPQVTTPKESAQEAPKATKEAAQVMPKAEPAKDVLPAKEPKTFKPTAAPTDVFKNFNFDPRKYFPAKTEETKPLDKPEAKLTDLSPTTSVPIKVLTKK